MMNYPFGDPRSGVSLREMMDRLFADAFIMPRERGVGGQGGQATQNAQTPPANMYETASDLMVVIPMPGISPNDIEVELIGTQLSVRSGARRDIPHGEVGPKGGDTSDQGDRNRAWYLHEFQIGPYARTIELPYIVNADQVHANYEHGLLSLRFPRPEADRPRKIQLQGGQQSSGGQSGRSGT